MLGLNGADWANLMVLFSLEAVLPVARKKIFDNTPTFLKFVFAATFRPTHRKMRRVSLSTELSIAREGGFRQMYPQIAALKRSAQLSPPVYEGTNFDVSGYEMWIFGIPARRVLLCSGLYTVARTEQ